MQTQEGMVTKGITLNVGLESEASTNDNTSTKQHDGSSSSGHATYAERARDDKTVSDKENVAVGTSLDNITLTEVHHSNNDIFENLFALEILNHEQLEVENSTKNDLSKPVTPHYWPKVRESAFVKPHHVIASSVPRNISKNMLRFSLNDMVHNHYLEEAKKKTQERDRNSKTSVVPSARLSTTTNGSKLKSRGTNQITRNWPTYNNSCITKTDVLKAVDSRNSISFGTPNALSARHVKNVSLMQIMTLV
nr:hypothetical protein [Tanacetum cinerariifolium]